MSFDRFLLADESCDLSQADKILIRVVIQEIPITNRVLKFCKLLTVIVELADMVLLG